MLRLQLEVLHAGIGVLDLVHDVLVDVARHCSTTRERLCERADLIPTGVAERAHLAKEIR